MSDLTQQMHRRPVPQGNPAAGAAFNLAPNTVGHWRLLGLLFQLVTSAAVANRHVRLALSDGTTTTWRATASADQAAGLTVVYQLAPIAVPANLTDGLAHIPMPQDGVWVPKGWTLAVTVNAIDVADQISAISMDVQEIPDGPVWTAEPSMALNVMALNQ